MRETLTEFEELQEALKRVDMNEIAMPVHNGKVVTENRESYCKMQQILDAPEMIKSHAYIMNLDPEQLEEDEIERVDKLWKLGVDRGFITPSDDTASIQSGLISPRADTADVPTEQPVEKPAFSYATQKVDVPCWTILYSACNKNGDVKTGECYSNSVNSRAAKADCYAKLEKCGYTNISILAIEAGDPDNCSCGNDAATKLLSEMPPKKDAPATSDAKMIPDEEFMNAANESKEEEIKEADTSFDEPEGETDAEFEKKQTPAKYDDLYREFLTAADDYQQIVDIQGETSVAAKNAFKEVQGAYEDCYAAVPSSDDERELLSQVNSYGFKLAADNCTITEADVELVDESGNPYLAGMKTADLNGPMKVSTGKKATQAKKLDEEDDEEDDDSSDDSNDSGDTTDDSDDFDDTNDDSNDSEEESADDDSDTSDDESTDDSEDSSEDSSDDDDSDSDDEETDTDIDSEDSDDSEETDDEEDDDSDDSDEETDDDEDEESDDEDEESDDDEVEDDAGETESKDLTDEEKAQYKSDYKKTFKDIMLKCKFEDKCFDDLSIAEKVEFFTKLQKAWKKNEPKDFMSDKEIEQLNKVVVKK